MNAVLRSALAQIAVGTAMQGGYFAGAYAIDDTPYGLIVSPKALGEIKAGVWIKDYKDVPGALSLVDGMANTEAMAEAGSALAKKVRKLDIEGFTDWYIGAVDELEIAYRAFKPTADKNAQWYRSGINLSAIPPTWPYTLELPAQTTVEAFRAGGPEAFEAEAYWTSTQHASDSDYAWSQYFLYGIQHYWGKDDSYRGRAVRRFPL